MASNIDVFVEGYRHCSAQLASQPMGEPWFHMRFSCFGGVQDATGRCYISINERGKWDCIGRVVQPDDVAAVLSSFAVLQPLNRNETLQSYEGLTKRLCIRIRKDSGPGVVVTKVFEAMGPMDPINPTLRSFVLNLFDLLAADSNDKHCIEIREFLEIDAL